MKQRFYFLRVAALIVVALILSTQNSFAQFKILKSVDEFGGNKFTKNRPTRLKAGPVRVHPLLETTMEYDDNVLFQPEDEREDIVFYIRPGVVLDLPIDQHRLLVGYEADIQVFTKNSLQNDQNQEVYSTIEFNFPDWYVKVTEEFRETSSRSGTTFTSRIPRYDNSLSARVGYKLGRTTFQAGFWHFLRDYRRQINDNLDYELTEWNGSIFYDLTNRLQGKVDYKVGQYDYDDDFTRAGVYQQVRVGVEGELTKSLLMRAHLGMHFRNYEESSEPNFNSWIGDIWLYYKMRENLAFELALKRDPVEATFSNANFYKRHSVQVGANYWPHPQWKLFSKYRYQNDRYAERTFVSGRFGFRRDDSHTSKTGVSYLFREWWEVEAAYQLKIRDSNFSTFDYTDNRFSLKSSLSY